MQTGVIMCVIVMETIIVETMQIENFGTSWLLVRGTFKSKAPLRVQFSPALGGRG